MRGVFGCFLLALVCTALATTAPATKNDKFVSPLTSCEILPQKDKTNVLSVKYLANEVGCIKLDPAPENLYQYNNISVPNTDNTMTLRKVPEGPIVLSLYAVRDCNKNDITTCKCSGFLKSITCGELTKKQVELKKLAKTKAGRAEARLSEEKAEEKAGRIAALKKEAAEKRLANKTAPATPAPKQRNLQEEINFAASQARANQAKKNATLAKKESEETEADLEETLGVSDVEVNNHLKALNDLGVEAFATRLAKIAESTDDKEQEQSLEDLVNQKVVLLSLAEAKDDDDFMASIMESDDDDTKQRDSLLPKDQIGNSKETSHPTLGSFFGTGGFGKSEDTVPMPEQLLAENKQVDVEESGDEDEVELLQTFSSEEEERAPKLNLNLEHARAKQRQSLAELELAKASMDAEDENGVAHNENARDLQRLKDAEASLNDGSLEEFLEETHHRLMQQALELGETPIDPEVGRHAARLLGLLPNESEDLLQKGGIENLLDDSVNQALGDAKPIVELETEVEETSDPAPMPEDEERLMAETETAIEQEKEDAAIAQPAVTATEEDLDSFTEAENFIDEGFEGDEDVTEDLEVDSVPEDEERLMAETESAVEQEKEDAAIAQPEVVATEADLDSWEQTEATADIETSSETNEDENDWLESQAAFFH